MSVEVGAFELEPAIEAAHLPDGEKISIVEFCGVGNVLYIGTDDGLLLEYTLPDYKTEATGHVLLRKAKELAAKSPVTFLRSASALEKVLVVCDSTLTVLTSLDLTPIPLAGSSKMKGVTACCMNENPITDDPFSVQVCLAKRKQLAVISISDQRLVVDKIKELPEPVNVVSMDGNIICAALPSHYVVYNVATGACTDLFPFEPETTPVVTRISKEEFLLSAVGNLGMFVTSAGTSERPPIQWTKPVEKCLYCHPYVISLSVLEDAIVVYSVLDQKAKQTLQFSGGKALGNFDGRLLVASGRHVFTIRPISVKIQIETLLNDGRIEEALALAENCQNVSGNELEAIINRARIQAGFKSLKKLDYNHAMDLLIRGQVDPKEVICLWPRLLPSSINFTRSVPLLHDIADVHQLSKGSSEITNNLQEFLIAFLEFIRGIGDSRSSKMAVETALLKLYAKSNPQKIPAFLQSPGIELDFDDCSKSLFRSDCHHSLALLHQKVGHGEQSITIWANLLNSTYKDDMFPGIEFFTRVVIESSDDVKWKYADLVLKQNQKEGVKIFIESFDKDDVQRIEKTVEYLHQYPSANLSFLEFVVTGKKTQIEKFHMLLAVTYLDLVKQDENNLDVRKKLRNLIVESSLLRGSFLMSKLESFPFELHQEKALLFGKMGDHVKALKILVHKLANFEEAELYCDKISESSENSSATKEKLLGILFEVYIDQSVGQDQSKELTSPAIDLLNRRIHEMDAMHVLDTIPGNWSVASVGQALIKLIRAKMHKKRMLSIQRSLEECQNLNVKLELIELTKTPIYINKNSYCMLCKKSFVKHEFTRYPNGVIVHPECAKNKKICPVTGKMFF